MTDLVYSFRINRFSPCTTYRQEAGALYWSNGLREGRIAYDSIERVESYKVRFWGSSATYWRCALHRKSGRPVYLQEAHYIGFRNIEARTAAYVPFIKQLEARIAQANPGAAFQGGRHWFAAFDAAVGHVAVGLLRLMRHTDLERMSNVAVWLMRRIGPRLRGHRVALENLKAAYPEKTAAEINAIALGMWDNLARLFIEYGHLDRLWDHDPSQPKPGRIVVDPAVTARVQEVHGSKGPVLIFGAHLANWELLAWAIAGRQGESAVVYRPPKNWLLQREIAMIRGQSSVKLIPADGNALFSIKTALQRNAAVGIIVDEHFSRGADMVFFGRHCKVSPILARFARQFDCPIYGGRMIRLPDGQFRLDVTGPIAAPRDANGKIEVVPTMQMITSIIEGWIREYPDQWNWMQRRWR